MSQRKNTSHQRTSPKNDGPKLRLPLLKADSREPEKLNNAQRFAYVDDSTGTTFFLRLGTHDVIIGWRGKEGYNDIADIKAEFDKVALEESSLSAKKR